MASLNRVFLIGNLTRDPELRYTAGGTGVTTLRLAVSRRYTVDGETREETLFIDTVVWGKSAEAACEHLAKGAPVLVEGRLISREWEGKDGQKRTTIEVVADRVQFLGRPRQAGAESAPADTAAISGPADADVPF
jgi:single-strand DNA-binding protein